MSIRVGVGTSEHADEFTAGKQAVNIACHQAHEDFLDLLLIFASPHYDQQELLRGIKSVCGNATTLGCSTAGEITNTAIGRNSVAVIGFKAAPLSFATGLGCGLSQDARAAGRKCAQETMRARLAKRHLFIMLPDGLVGNGAEVIRGIQDVLGISFPIVGGCAGDNYLFQKTYQYYQDSIFSDAVTGVLLGGNITVGIGTRHGWRAIGKAHQVTRAQGNLVESIDHKPAFGLYQDYFQEAADELQELPWAELGTIYPLGMSIPEEEEYLIRYAYKATSTGALVCAAEVPQGSQVRLMIADKEKVIEAAKEAAVKAKENVKAAKIKAAFIFDSIARKRILGRCAKDEITAIKKILGEDVPIIGFYSYGEQAPLKAERYIGKSYFQNETIVVACIAESK